MYAILFPGRGIAVIGLVMLRAGFGRLAAYLGIATGVLAAVSVPGPLVVDGAGVAAILASVLTTVWLLVVGHWLLRPVGRSRAGVRTGTG